MAKVAGRPMIPYDGMTDAYVTSFEAFMDAFKDPEYLEKIRPDELALFDVDNLQMTIGYDYQLIIKGEEVKTHKKPEIK